MKTGGTSVLEKPDFLSLGQVFSWVFKSLSWF